MASSSAKSQAASADIVCGNLNLQLYSGRYSGNTKLLRLLFVAERCSNLRVEALSLLLAAIKSSCSVFFYRDTMKVVDRMISENKLDVAQINEANFSADQEWLSSAEKRLRQRSERLESELMTAKTTMVKESVRLAYGELWQYHCDGGNLAEANKTLLKSRDFCSAPNHVMDLCIRSALTSLDSGDCRAVQQHASKADQPEADAATKNRLKLFLGIVSMRDCNLVAACKRFLDVDVGLLDDLATVATHEDIALYGALCALATLGPADMRAGLQEASKFRRFLESAPDVRVLVNSFFEGRFSDCLLWLHTNKPRLLLDLHLCHAADAICDAIRDQIFVRYALPYKTVSLSKMATVLGLGVAEVEETSASLISRGRIPARIDAHAKTLLRCEEATKQATVNKILALARRHAKDAKKAVLRLSLQQHGPLGDKDKGPKEHGGHKGRGNRGGRSVGREEEEEEEEAEDDDMDT